MKYKNLYCLIGPSSTGKDAIKKASEMPSIVSYRTREMRVGEVEGVDGHFITEEEFLKVDPDDWIAKTFYSGNYYGVKKEQLKQLKVTELLYVIDWDGVEYLKEKHTKGKIVTIFIDTNPNKLEDRMRLQKRTKKEIKERLLIVEKDLKHKSKCDYVIDNNGTIEESVRQLNKIVKDTR